MMTIEYTSDGLVALVAGGERLPLLGFKVHNTVEQVEDTEDETITHEQVTGATVTFQADFRKVRIIEANAG